MKLISARQAWHDAYYDPSACQIAEAIAEARRQLRKSGPTTRSRPRRFPAAYSGAAAEDAAEFLVAMELIRATETRGRSRVTSLNRAAHMHAAGKVMYAISTLAPPLQHFGHFLHHPEPKPLDQNRAHSFLYFSTDLPNIHRHRRETAWWVCLAALYSWRGQCRGAEEWWPGRIAGLVADWSGIALDVSHWQRDWAEIWDLYLAKADELEALALRPIRGVIDRQEGAA